jgi:nicotinate-nucleotide adenylyltransferase
MIGVYGGTFDPVHIGHLRPALDCLQTLGLAELRLIPLKVAVHRSQPEAPASLRLAMLRAAVAGEPRMIVDPRELERPGSSYSVDTLRSLRGDLGEGMPICLLMGLDAFAGFLDWHEPEAILELAHLVVMRRPKPGQGEDLSPGLRRLYGERACDGRDALEAAPAGRILMQQVTQLDIASTRIRALIRAGLSARYLVPDPVLAIIERAGLYRGSSDRPGNRDPAPRARDGAAAGRFR